MRTPRTPCLESENILTARRSAVGWGGGRTHLLLAFNQLTIDHASLSRRSIVFTPDRRRGGGCSLAAFLSPLIIDHARSFRHGVWLEGAGRAGATEVNVLVLLKRPVG